MALWPSIVYCCRPMNGDEFGGKAAESLKNETLRYVLSATRCRFLISDLMRENERHGTQGGDHGHQGV
jgi:hypothetical protein